METVTEEYKRIGSWIHSQWSSDPDRFAVVISDFTVLELTTADNSLLVKYQFWGDESRINESPQCYLFEDLISRSKYDIFIPSNLQLCTFLTRYSWRDSQSFANFSDDFDEESIDPHVDCITWDDSRMDSDLISMYIFSSNEQSLARLLIDEYQADKQLPEFIPLNLTSFMTSLIHSFK